MSTRMVASVLVFLGYVVVAVYGQATLQYTDCNNSPNKIAHFENAHISADPVHIPGPEVVDITMQLLRDISGHQFTAHVHLQKKLLFGYIIVRCVNNVGSCDYDLCDLLSGSKFENNTHHCPMEIAQSSPDFPCSCPFTAGTYTLNPTKFNIPEPSSLWNFLATGDYKARLTINDTSVDPPEEVFCYDLAVHLESDCTGPLCLIGK